MLKQVFIVFFSLFITCVSYAQLSVDTLVIANSKFPIKRAKTYIHQWGKLALPCEYEELEKTINVFYKSDADTVYGIYSEDKFGGDVVVAVLNNSYDTSRVKYTRVEGFIDTVYIKLSEFKKLKPFIKSKKGNVNFFRAEVYALKNDSLTSYSHYLRPNGDIFSFWADTWFSVASDEDIKRTTFIVKDLYYRKGLTTYYFNREFIVIVK